MREIKFRALGTKGWKPTEDKGWFYGTLNYKDFAGENKKPQHEPLWLFLKHINGNYLDKNTICQYTGLKDKNEVDIYQNDIVQIADKNFVVEFANGCFVYKIMGDYIPLGNRIADMGIEVIGNIYENPELLNG